VKTVYGEPVSYITILDILFWVWNGGGGLILQSLGFDMHMEEGIIIYSHIYPGLTPLLLYLASKVLDLFTIAVFLVFSLSSSSWLLLHLDRHSLRYMAI
jgi:hypothetical protein